MRILIIGGSGFIGTPLARELHNSGHEVTVFHRHGNGSATGNVRELRGDRNQLMTYKDQIAQFAPQVVIDLILSSGRQAQGLMRTLRGISQRVVVISSMDVYRAWGVLHGSEPGPLEPLPITEDSPLRTTRQLYPPETLKTMANLFSWLDTDYDKIAVELAIMGDPDLPGAVLRLPMVYGPGDPLRRFFPLLKRIADGRSFVLLADEFAAWRGPRGYVENVAHAIAVVATSELSAGSVHNICEEPTISELQWQKRIASQMSWLGRFVVLPREQVPKHLWLPGNGAQHVVVSSERIRSDLGYREPVETDEAIRRTISWERQNPPKSVDPQQFDYASEDAALANAA
jgi:nucleoside-diphosphate-sugar epimerase